MRLQAEQLQGFGNQPMVYGDVDVPDIGDMEPEEVVHMDEDGSFVNISSSYPKKVKEPYVNLNDLFVSDIVFFEVVHDMPAVFKQLKHSNQSADRGSIAVTWLSPVSSFPDVPITFVSSEPAKVCVQGDVASSAALGVGKRLNKVATHHLLSAGLWTREVWKSIQLYEVGDPVYYFDHDDMRLKLPSPYDDCVSTSAVLERLLNRGPERLLVGSNMEEENFLKITEENQLTQSESVGDDFRVWTLTPQGKSLIRVASSLSSPHTALPEKSPEGEPVETCPCCRYFCDLKKRDGPPRPCPLVRSRHHT